jgi:hypothetical protein
LAAAGEGATSVVEEKGSPARIWQSSSWRCFCRGVHISISSSRSSVRGAGLFRAFFVEWLPPVERSGFEGISITISGDAAAGLFPAVIAAPGDADFLALAAVAPGSKGAGAVTGVDRLTLAIGREGSEPRTETLDGGGMLQSIGLGNVGFGFGGGVKMRKREGFEFRFEMRLKPPPIGGF